MRWYGVLRIFQETLTLLKEIPSININRDWQKRDRSFRLAAHLARVNA